jgi:hypothetical protein
VRTADEPRSNLLGRGQAVAAQSFIESSLLEPLADRLNCRLNILAAIAAHKDLDARERRSESALRRAYGYVWRLA